VAYRKNHVFLKFEKRIEVRIIETD